MWIVSIDHEVTEADLEAIQAMVPDDLESNSLVNLHAEAKNSLVLDDPEELGAIFRLINLTLAEESRAPFLSMMLRLVISDLRVSASEKYALMFISDVAGCSELLPQLYERFSGRIWEMPGDLSDPGFWDSKNQRSGTRQGRHKKSERASKEQTAPAGNDGAERIRALAILGLVGNPSKEEIKTAFRRLAKIHHPDRFQTLDAEAQGHATLTFQRLEGAYRALMGE